MLSTQNWNKQTSKQKRIYRVVVSVSQTDGVRKHGSWEVQTDPVDEI